MTCKSSGWQATSSANTTGTHLPSDSVEHWQGWQATSSARTTGPDPDPSTIHPYDMLELLGGMQPLALTPLALTLDVIFRGHQLVGVQEQHLSCSVVKLRVDNQARSRALQQAYRSIFSTP